MAVNVSIGVEIGIECCVLELGNVIKKDRRGFHFLYECNTD